MNGTTTLRGSLQVLSEDGASSSFVFGGGLLSALSFTDTRGEGYLVFDSARGDGRISITKPLYIENELHIADDFNVTGDTSIGNHVSDDVDILGSVNSSLPDNTNDGFAIMEGSENYFTVDTTDGGEKVELHVDTLISSTTTATSTSTGSLIVAGGAGIAENAYVPTPPRYTQGGYFSRQRWPGRTTF